MKKILFVCAAVLSLLACSNNEDYNLDPAAQEKAQKQEYAENFVDVYGEIDPNKTWDFTDFTASLTQPLTRADGDGITAYKVNGLDFGLNYDVALGFSGYYLTNRTMSKNVRLFEHIDDKLPEGQKHEGEPVVLTAPGNSFTIYPICAQGAWTHDLYVKVGNNAPVLLYSKTWNDYSRPYVNGDVLQGKVTGNPFSGYTYTATSTVNMPGLYVDAPVGTPIEIYLANIKDGRSAKDPVGTFNGRAIYVDCDVMPDVEGILPNSVVKYVGIEDQIGGGDKDYNDVVLAIVGNPNVPEEIKVTNDEYDMTSSVSKRYMIEDLGSTGDFDFNDIVVDVIESTRQVYKRTITNGVVTDTQLDRTEVSQEAVIRHLGGELPFQLTIGDSVLPSMDGSMGPDRQGVDVEERYGISGWNYYTNNISVQILRRNQGSGVVYTIPFPKAGEVPMIVAFPVTQGWMPERQHVPSDWFYSDISYGY